MNLSRQPVVFAVVGAAVAVAVTLALGGVEWRLRESVFESARLVDHTLEVQREFEALLAVEDDSNAGAARMELAKLRSLTADNASQQARLETIGPMLGNGNEAERLRAAIAEGIAEEQALLTRREAAFQSTVDSRGYLIWGLIAFNAAALGVVLWMMWRVQRLESFATVCAESRTIQYENDWLTFDEYLLRRFRIKVTHGLSPDEADKIMARITESQIYDRR